MVGPFGATMALVAMLCLSTLVDMAAASQLRTILEASTPSENEGYCALVRDAGAMGLIEVEVGSPPTSVNLVVDTGSNVLIVESCACQDAEACLLSEACFDNTSSGSFGEMYQANGTARELVLSFGSGVIGGVVGKEKVRIGNGNPVYMKDGMLFMTDRNLDFDDNFEGILGLGPPEYLVQEAMDEARQAADDEIKALEKAAHNASAEEQAAINEAAAEMKARDNESESEPLGFLEQAGFHRFALCFGRGNDSNGTLTVGGAPAAEPLKSIGKMHWGLAVTGVTVGDQPVVATEADPVGEFSQVLKETLGGPADNRTVSALKTSAGHLDPFGAAFLKAALQQTQRPQKPTHVCSPDSMKAGQETPCGFIPDSGTTTIAMPQEHLKSVAAAICDSWDRCKHNYTKFQEAKDAAGDAAAKVYGINPFDLPDYSKADVLSFVLSDCNGFGQDVADVMAELPDIKVVVSDAHSRKHVGLTIPAASYVFQVDIAEEMGMADPSGAAMGCMLGLSAMEYITEKNGPVWILGKPLFHEYEVLYDLGDNTIGFKHTDVEPCGICQAGKQLGLLASSANVSTRPQVALRRRAPLKVPRKHFRKPRIDTTKPF